MFQFKLDAPPLIINSTFFNVQTYFSLYNKCYGHPPIFVAATAVTAITF